MLFHLSFHNKDQTKMFTIYKIYSKGNLFSIFFFGRGGEEERGVGVNINFIQAVLTCIHHYRLEAV